MNLQNFQQYVVNEVAKITGDNQAVVRILEATVANLHSSFPLFAPFLEKLPWVATRYQPFPGQEMTFATDGILYYYNPDFVKEVMQKGEAEGRGKGFQYIAFIMLHEVLHNALNHFVRDKIALNKYKWNIAADGEINYLLNGLESEFYKPGSNEGMKLSIFPGGVFSKQFLEKNPDFEGLQGMSAEEIFNKMPDIESPSGGGKGGCPKGHPDCPYADPNYRKTPAAQDVFRKAAKGELTEIPCPKGGICPIPPDDKPPQGGNTPPPPGGEPQGPQPPVPKNKRDTNRCPYKEGFGPATSPYNSSSKFDNKGRPNCPYADPTYRNRPEIKDMYDKAKKGELKQIPCPLDGTICPIPPEGGAEGMQAIEQDEMGYKVPEDWRMWAAGNRPHEAGDLYNQLPPNVRRRFVHFTLVPEADAWLKFFRSEKDQAIVSNAYQAAHGTKVSTTGPEAKFDPSQPLKPGYEWEKTLGPEGEERPVINATETPMHQDDVDAFIDWKREEMLDPESEEMEKEFGSFRNPDSWVRFGKYINRFEQTNKREMTNKEIFDTAHSFLGPAAAVAFSQFMNLRRFFPHHEIEKMYSDGKNAILLPLATENLEGEADSIAELTASIGGGMEGSEKDRVDAINVEAKNRKEYSKVKTVAELVGKGKLKQGERPHYRPDVQAAVGLELSSRLKDKLTPAMLQNLVDYVSKLQDSKAAMSLLSSATKVNPKFKEKYSQERNKILRPLFTKTYPDIYTKAGEIPPDLKDMLDMGPEGPKKEHLDPRNMVDLLRLCEHLNK